MSQMSGWIAVENGLPKYGEPVLGLARIYPRMPREILIVLRTHTDLDGEHWRTYDGSCGVGQHLANNVREGDGDEVTHWMPLPSMYPP